LVTLPLLAASFAGGLLFSGRALRPVQRLTRSFRSIIATGRIEGRLSDPGRGDELAELVSLYNAMLERIDALIRGMREALDNVAHDLRTPMARFRATAESALQSPGDSEALREALADAMEESERVLTMLRILMDISEAETGTMKLNLAQGSMFELVRRVLELYQIVAEEKSIALAAEVPEELRIEADQARLEQALANLLDNAIKYTPRGGRVTVRARAVASAVADPTGLGPDSQVELAVEDNGLGIQPEEVPRIWDRLYRGDKSRNEKGLGLGLSLVKAVVQAHGGTVQVASQPGQGSVFTVTLPARQPRIAIQDQRLSAQP
jgi:signal transduction histidine kinase